MSNRHDSSGQPLVSVVVTTCDRPDYLRLALKSVLDQTYEHIEVLICDDSPSAESHSVVESFSDPRIKYRPNAQRLGMAPNKLTGLRAAQGDYVANLDDDDVWESEFLSTLVGHLETDPDLVVAFSRHFVINEAGHIEPETTKEIERKYRGGLTPGKHQPFCRIGLIDRSVPTSVATVVRRSSIDWSFFPAEADITWDVWLTYLACRTGGGAYFEGQPLARYRVHSGSSTAAGGVNWHRSFVACYEEFLRDQNLGSLHRPIRQACSLTYTNMGIAYLRMNQPADARRCFRAALSKQLNARGVAALILSTLPRPIRYRLLKVDER